MSEPLNLNDVDISIQEWLIADNTNEAIQSLAAIANRLLAECRELRRKLAEETERCAKIAEARVDSWDNIPEIQVSQDIAALIRRPPQEETK